MYEIDTSRVRSPLDNPKWDLKNSGSGNYNGRRVEEVNLEDLQSVIKLKPPPKTTWEPDVKAMISTKKWLGTHGLKRNRLTLHQILPAIGFKHFDDFDRALKKPICSRYGEGMFNRYPKKDGKVYNITVSKERLKQLENSLLQAIVLYKRRLEWLTTESRRLFGVIEEHCITIVLDIKTNNPTMFDHCRNALVRVLDEQIGQVAKFNLIRAGQDMVVFQDSAVPVCRESLDKAIEWIVTLDHAAATTKTSATEAVLKAMGDKNIEAIYLFSEGGSTESARELLKQKISGGPMPVNTVGFNSTDSITIQFLKDVARITGGRFHAFAFTKLDSDVYGTSAYNSDQKLLHGGVPPGAGMRDDVVKLWEELEEARSTLSEIQLLSEDAIEGKGDGSAVKDADNRETLFRGDQYLTSKDWLTKHGLNAKKLGFFDVLAGVAFKHCDGVVDVKGPPDDDFTDAAIRNKLINAQYCDKFCHVLWKDGTVKHVHVTADVHRNYERRMAVALDALQQRIDWLQQGSRELFGTIIEDQVYILIDVSNSMEPHLDLVKEKLIRLMEEQLRHKMKFNLIKFGTRATMWRDRMVDVNEANLHSAWTWVRGLSVHGTTNTLSAVKLALSDPNTQAIYLLTDGRPDQPPKTVLAQVQLQQKVPIHTISFNCADTEANQFLAQLAADTGGRYHYFSEQGTRDPGGPMPFESEDIRRLKEELYRGREDLSKIARLRAECAALDWTNNRHADPGCSRDHGLPQRPASAPGMRMESPKPPITPRTTRPMSAFGTRELTTHIKCHSSQRAGTFPRPGPLSKGKPKLVAGHTRTSLMRTMSSTSFDPSKQWMLPETRELFEKQWSKFKQALEETNKRDREEKRKLKKRTPRIKDQDPYEMSSKRWLKIYGLRARKLTIMDALSPTAIPHRAKYVPIIDKYVLSKVFDEVLPLAHTTGSNRKEVKLINPHGVNLVDYEERLQDAIDTFTKRLDTVVWRALTQEERDKFGSDSAGPVSFMDNKLEIMQALDRLNWPLREDDILLLQEEIEQAYKYLQQSKDLRKAAERKSSLSSIGSYSNRPKSGKKVRRKKKQQRRNDDYDDIEDEIIDDGDDGDDVFDDKSTPSHTARDYEGIAGSMISETSSSKKAPISRRRIQKILDKRKGMHVVGRSESDGLYYPGIITSCPDARHVEVSFRDLAEEILPSRFVIPIGGARPCPGLRVGDYVLVKTGDDEFECWVPAIVQHTPEDINRQAKFFTVLKYNNRQCTAHRSELIKITKSRFSFALRFILELQKEQHQRDMLTASSPINSDDNRRHSRKHHRRHRKHRHRHRKHRRDRDSDQDEDEIANATGRHSSSDRSKSRSRSESKSQSRSRSRSRSRSPDMREGAQAPTPTPRSGWNALARPRSRSRSRSRSPPGSDRSGSVRLSARTGERFLKDHHRKLEELQRKLEEQQAAQFRAQADLKIQQENLVDAARRLYDAKINELQTTQSALQGEQEKLQRQQRELIEKQERQMKEAGKLFVSREDFEARSTGRKETSRPSSQKSSPRIHGLRKLKEGEEVLARWSDDGWYYRGTVASTVDENTYLISDSVGDLEQIIRTDIVTDDDDSENIIKPNDPVIALHPSYSFSYSPGVVLNIYPDLWTHIRYYDGEEAKVPREEVYKITPEKFENDVKYILQCEDSWVGQAVVARNDTDGMYYLGQVKERVGNGRQYIVEWADGSLQIQNSSCIFGAFTKRHRLALGDKVLAIVNSQSLVYLPGNITSVSGNDLVVKFCNGSSSSHVDPQQCFWLSQDYFDSAVAFYGHRQDDLTRSEGSSDSDR